MLPHAICLNFDVLTISLMILGDGMTAVSYMLIPFLLQAVLRDMTRLQRFAPENLVAYQSCFFSSRYWLSTLFQSFILSCGCGHLLKILVIYQAAYKIEIAVDLWTGITSILTVILLFLVRKSAIRCASTAL